MLRKKISNSGAASSFFCKSTRVRQPAAARVPPEHAPPSAVDLLVLASSRAPAARGCDIIIGVQHILGRRMDNLICQKTRTCDARGEDAIHEFGVPRVRFEDLPMDLVYRILSKLPPKEFARANVLSSKLRCTWSVCPRLTFDGVQVCKCNRRDLGQHIGRFIHEVNAVLQKHHGKVVETLEVRMDLVNDSLLVHHLNNWVNFAASSRTKNLTLDLKHRYFYFEGRVDRYVFPFQLLDSGSISRLQHMQLSFVSLKPPSHHRGFPNLKKLYLQLVHASTKDLGQVLSQCCNLEWLCMDRCYPNDELVVNGPLSHLLYLRIDLCELTKIEFHAMNLATFEYYGDFIPIGLGHSLKLQSANIFFYEAVFQDALILLLNGLQNVENLTFRIGWLEVIKKQWLWDNPLKFSRLKHLQLVVEIYDKNVDSILYLVSFLRATPFIEDLEVHFSGGKLWLADVGPRRQDIGQCNPYKHLKKMCITGFKGARGHVEFMLHAVENAPALEVITVDTHDKRTSRDEHCTTEIFEEAKRIATSCLSGTIPPSAKLDVI